MKKSLRYAQYAALVAMVSAAAMPAQAQNRRGGTTPPPATTQAPVANPAASAAPKTGIRPYREIITDKAKTDNGMFKVHRLDGKYFFEIPDSMFNREMLVVTRYAKTPTIDGTYGGEELNEQVWKWQRRDKQVLVRVPSYRNVAAKGTDMYQSVQNSNLDAVLASFDIKALNKDSNSVVIDVTDLYAKDVQSLGLPQSLRTQYKFLQWTIPVHT